MNSLVTGREPHPVLALLNPEIEKAYPQQAEEFYAARRDTILAMQGDPLRYGFEPPIWDLADQHQKELRALFPKGVIHLFVCGGNRSGKSFRAAKRVVQAMVEKPGSRWWCADATETASRSNQQRLIWQFIPPEWKNEYLGTHKGGRRSKTTKIKYSVAGGFTENIFVLPNGSECEFKFYEQKTGSLQAVELDGFWGDELLPLDWIETIEYRLINRNGVFHLTFTPVTGFTPTVGHYLNEARTLSEVDAPLLPKKDEKGKTVGYEKVPRALQCRDPKARVIYFHTEDNPFGNYEGMVEQVKLKSRAEVRMRVYGVVDKASHVQFAMFKDDVHVISINRFKEILRSNPQATRYHVVDPCSGRNWFMLWVLCPKPDQWIIYREWPSHGHEGAYIPGIGDPGEWAVIGEAEDGERGLAQEPFGFGLTRYKEEILRVEKTFDFKKNELVQEEIFERWIDSRYANSPREEREGSTTLIEQMRDLDMEFCAMTSEKRILNVQDGSIDMINERLYYDTETPLGNFSATLARKNEPQLLVTENCPNTIFAFKNWTGKDGQHGAAKDPIDCVRGIFLSQLQYIGPEAYAWKGGGSY